MKWHALCWVLALGSVTGCNQADPIDAHEGVDAGADDVDVDGGGGSGGGGAGSDGGTGAGGGSGAPKLDYFPLHDGASWKYLHSNGAWMETIAVSASSDAGRFLVTSSADPDGIAAESTLERADGEVSRVAEDTLLDGVLDRSVTYDPGFLRFADAWVDVEPGFSERRDYQRIETQSGQAPKDPMPRAHIYTVESVSESVNVPAGSFRNCLRVHRARDFETTDSTGATISEEQEKLYWFCPGVGKVREENVMSGSTESLMEYDL